MPSSLRGRPRWAWGGLRSAETTKGIADHPLPPFANCEIRDLLRLLFLRVAFLLFHLFLGFFRGLLSGFLGWFLGLGLLGRFFILLFGGLFLSLFRCFLYGFFGLFLHRLLGG